VSVRLCVCSRGVVRVAQGVGQGAVDPATGIAGNPNFP
jgi:hypothetical protein